MIRRPPRSTRTDTLFPYTTLFRSHPLVVTMSAGNSPARAKMLEGLGAEVVLIAQVDGSPSQLMGSDVNAAAQAASEIARARDGFYVDQFYAADGIAAPKTTYDPEILERKRVVYGKRGSIIMDVGGSRLNKKKN